MQKKVKKEAFLGQAQFCKQLIDRLVNDIECETIAESKPEVYSLNNRSRFQDDIRRIRRELNDLSHMFKW